MGAASNSSMALTVAGMARYSEEREQRRETQESSVPIFPNERDGLDGLCMCGCQRQCLGHVHTATGLVLRLAEGRVHHV